ncbi:TRAP transporter small permease [Marinobacter sp. JSM 1782161]|uniref:TRAP transporter small permease n=1 Tax=Marinobacter sp. JSM 1782161 TaxID=2685906 RepID=UPI0014032140|nr:TRAP transporter small permease [Marinobacter sp. JSM 1782161]
MKIFNLFDCALDRVIAPLVAITGLAIALSFVIGVVARSFIGVAMFGLEELILIGVVWFYMMGAVLASKERSHLHADFVSVIFKSEKAVLISRIVSTLLSIVMAVFFVMWSYSLFQWGVDRGEKTPIFAIPVFISQASVFVAAILMTLYLLRDLISDIGNLALHSSKS